VSLLGGFLIPILYTMVAGPLSVSVESPFVKRLLEVPIRWPILFVQSFFPDLFLMILMNNASTWLFAYTIVCNVVVYSAVTYLLLWRFWKRKPEPSTLPPQPPRLEST
jgi:hypothetical protein